MIKKNFWVFALSSLVYFTQGIENLPSQSLFYYLKETLSFPAEKIMLLASITTVAWLVKPIIGYVIDNFLTKRAWIFISLAIDVASVMFLGSAALPIVIIVTMLIVTSTDAAFRDVSVDGIMCVEGKKNNTTGKIQSIQWISISIAGLITGIGGGFIAEKWNYKAAFLFLIPVYFLVALPAYFYKEEPALEDKASSTFLSDMKKLFSHKKILILSLFIFLYAYSPSFGTPLLFIQRDQFKWSKIWIGTLGTIGTVFQIAGALFYYKFSQRINIKKWLFFSVFLGALTTLCYLYYTPVTAVAYDIAFSFIGMFVFLLTLDFMARNSISGLEATSFALLCSVNNLAQTTSSFSGAILLPVVGLKWLIILSAFTSFLCLFLIKKI